MFIFKQNNNNINILNVKLISYFLNSKFNAHSVDNYNFMYFTLNGILIWLNILHINIILIKYSFLILLNNLEYLILLHNLL